MKFYRFYKSRCSEPKRDAIGKYEPEDDEPTMSVVNFDIGSISAADIKEASSGRVSNHSIVAKVLIN